MTAATALRAAGAARSSELARLSATDLLDGYRSGSFTPRR